MQQSAPNHCRSNLPPFFTQYFRQPLKLLLVGTDHATQTSIQTYLPTSFYKITACDSGLGALRYLREKGSDSFDLVLSDIALKDIDGYQFIREQQLNPNIAHVAICGGERSTDEILKAYRSGACSVLWKPVSELGDEIGNLWRHVCRRREQHERTSKTHDAEQQNKNKGSSSSSLSSKDTSLEEDDYLEFVNHGGEPASIKRRRLSWKDTHQLFVNAVNQLGGPENAKPRQIIDIMNVPGLTRAHVGSHLQKYRARLKRMEEEQQHYSVSQMNGSLFTMEPYRYNYHLVRQPIQMQIQPPEQNFNNFGASGSFYYITTGGASNDGIINKKHARGAPFGSNMQQQPQISTSFGSNQNLTFGIQQPDQIPALGSSSCVNNATRIANNEGIINKKQALGTSFGSSMQLQPHIGTNLTSSMQPQNQNPASDSSCYVGITGGANNEGMINQKQALSTSFESNMQPQPQIGAYFGSNQNLTDGVQQLDQDPATGSTSFVSTSRGANNDGTINQNQAISFTSKMLQQPQISQDKNLEAGGHDGMINPEPAGHGGIINPEEVGGHRGIINPEASHVTEDDHEESDFWNTQSFQDLENFFELLDDNEPSLQELE